MEDKTPKAAGDDRLAGTCYDWLAKSAAMEPKDRKEFAELRVSELKTARPAEETARVHVNMEKLGAHDRTHALAIAARRGCIQL